MNGNNEYGKWWGIIKKSISRRGSLQLGVIEVKNMLYDVKTLLDELNLNDKEKKKLIEEIRKEFPHDEMLFELHLFRANKYLKNRKKS